MSAFTFYLGTHQIQWMAHVSVPLFVSRRRLYQRKSFHRAAGPWILDSGGFTEISTLGHWAVPPRQYVGEVRRFQQEIGRMEYAAPQDWMCEPQILHKTGLTLRDHLQRTVDNYRELLDLAPDIPWMPVVQGWNESDYLRCVDLYDKHGIDLRTYDKVAVGTMCRRQATREASVILNRLGGMDLKLHGLGFKISGLPAVLHSLTSADSMAWSFHARKSPPLQECVDEALRGERKPHKNCANCLRFALRWYERVMALVAEIEAQEPRPVQLPLFSMDEGEMVA